MAERPGDESIGFADFAPLLEACFDRSLLRAFMLGATGPFLLWSPRMMQKLLLPFFHTVVGELGDEKDQKEIKAFTKKMMLAWLDLPEEARGGRTFLTAWLEFADEARRHRDQWWEINKRVMQRFGEAMDEVTAEFNRPKT
jgi:hypothetical protein